MFKPFKRKKNPVVKRVWKYSYFPLESSKQIELRRNIRERFAR